MDRQFLNINSEHVTTRKKQTQTIGLDDDYLGIEEDCTNKLSNLSISIRAFQTADLVSCIIRGSVREYQLARGNRA